MDYEEQLNQWFETYSEYDYKPKLSFETLDISKKHHIVEQVSAIMFLASKLKKEYNEQFFLQGEHDTLYIGSSFDVFEDFSEEDVKIAVAHGIYLAEDGDGFQMYASI